MNANTLQLHVRTALGALLELWDASVRINDDWRLELEEPNGTLTTLSQCDEFPDRIVDLWDHVRLANFRVSGLMLYDEPLPLTREPCDCEGLHALLRLEAYHALLCAIASRVRARTKCSDSAAKHAALLGLAAAYAAAGKPLSIATCEIAQSSGLTPPRPIGRGPNALNRLRAALITYAQRLSAHE
jgi:hypothetical protein